MTDRLPATHEGLAAAATILAEGGLVAFPTDTVYGLGCTVARPEAIEAIYALKRRPPEKRVAILVHGLEAVEAGTWVVDERVRLLAGRFWPGALSLVLPARDDGGTPVLQGARPPRGAGADPGGRGRCTSPAPTSATSRTRSRRMTS